MFSFKRGLLYRAFKMWDMNEMPKINFHNSKNNSKSYTYLIQQLKWNKLNVENKTFFKRMWASFTFNLRNIDRFILKSINNSRYELYVLINMRYYGEIPQLISSNILFVHLMLYCCLLDWIFLTYEWPQWTILLDIIACFC